ncbi:DUF3143 domain-containing protein [[Phormidium] sp. ETS-05]|uniref:DUF3143 domain-containing protein n=1 Tax=[Phormidium] sp. ETS-05 TaxID=222819 RepID=UPI0018EF3591|nr:DUF3143 domain-containing protein [[Phormidium] sp. ETS-05]
MNLPSPDTPLYNHPLPQIEQWLRELGCEQDSQELNFWRVEKPTWKAVLSLDVEHISIRYINSGYGSQDIERNFKYSLTRQDIESAILAGP